MTISTERASSAAAKVYETWLAGGLSFEEALRQAVQEGAILATQQPRRVGLTPAQLELLFFIESFIEENGFPPSFDEMREAINLRSKSGVHRLIEGLVERGAIRRLPNRARALEVVAA